MNLKDSFEYITLQLKPDFEGECIATLIESKQNTNNRDAVLYFHGHTDYFHNPEVASKHHENGYDFYAIEFRKFGNSLLPHQSINICTDIREYHEEITLAIDKIKQVNKHKLIFNAHSMGGLVANHYLNYGTKKEKIDAVIYNAPMFGFAGNQLKNKITYKSVKHLLVKILPMGCLHKPFHPAHITSIHKDFLGEWDFNLNWKPLRGNPIYYKWVVTMYEAIEDMRSNSNLSIPALVLYPEKSIIPKKIDEKIMTADTILDIKHMKEYGPKVGNNVTLIEIKDALHNIFLSRKDVREYAYSSMFDWLKNNI